MINKNEKQSDRRMTCDDLPRQRKGEEFEIHEGVGYGTNDGPISYRPTSANNLLVKTGDGGYSAMKDFVS